MFCSSISFAAFEQLILSWDFVKLSESFLYSVCGGVRILKAAVKHSPVNSL